MNIERWWKSHRPFLSGSSRKTEKRFKHGSIQVQSETETVFDNDSSEESLDNEKSSTGNILDLRNLTEKGDDEQDLTTYDCRGILSKAPYYIPVLKWLPRYNWRQNFSSDLVAGIGVAFMIIPQSLAFAKLAGLQPVYGLYTAWIATLVYGIFGTCGQFSIGPDALASLLVGLEAATLSEELGLDPIVITPILALFSGLLLFLMGLFRVGFLDNVLSQPLLAGFVNAVGFIIIIDQVDTLLGIKISPGEVNGYGIYKLPFIFAHVNNVHWPTLSIAFGTIVILFVFRFVKTILSSNTILKMIPETMLVVVLTTALVGTLRLDEHGIIIMGKIPTSFIPPELPKISSWQMAQEIFPSSVLIAIIGFAESLIVSKMYLSRQHAEYSPNRELVAVGVANILGSFFHTWPTFASLPRSSLAKFMGAQSQIFGFVVSTILLLSIVFFAQFLYYLPRATLSGIVVVAAFSLLEVHDVRFLIKIRAWLEAFLSCAIFLLTLIVGVDYGILISISVSIFMVIKHSSFPHISVLGKVQSSQGSAQNPGTLLSTSVKNKYQIFRDLKTHPMAVAVPGIIILKIEESLYFANIQQIKKVISRMELLGDIEAHPSKERDKSLVPLRAVILHSRYISTMDGSAVQVLVDLMKSYSEKGIFMCFVKLNEAIVKYFLRCGVQDLDGQRFFSRTEDAFKFANSYNTDAINFN